MSPLEQLRQSARNTTELANAVMANPNTTAAEFAEAHAARDIAYVESLGYSEEQIGEARWETMCGVNGDDSPFHTYFGYRTPDLEDDLRY